MRRACTTLLAAALACTACAANPRARYIDALDQRLEGNAAGYRDGLVALAHDAPDSRAGRRAQAILGPSGLIETVALLGAAVSFFGPNLTALAMSRRGDEAERRLHDIYEHEHAYFDAHNRYCDLFLECGFVPDTELHYLYMLSMGETVGSTGGVERDLYLVQIDAQLAGMGIHPYVGQNNFLILAVANLDDDPELDVWALDDDGTIVHLVSDR